MMKIEGSGSISQINGSPDPDPHQNVRDLQHCFSQQSFTLVYEFWILVGKVFISSPFPRLKIWDLIYVQCWCNCITIIFWSLLYLFSFPDRNWGEPGTGARRSQQPDPQWKVGTVLHGKFEWCIVKIKKIWHEASLRVREALISIRFPYPPLGSPPCWVKWQYWPKKNCPALKQNVDFSQPTKNPNCFLPVN